MCGEEIRAIDEEMFQRLIDRSVPHKGIYSVVEPNTEQKPVTFEDMLRIRDLIFHKGYISWP